MKRWRALFCAVLLCGICLSGLCVPVSAADEPATMLYNGVELPNIESVWTDKTTYPYAAIFLYESSGYNLILSSRIGFMNIAQSGAYAFSSNAVVKRYKVVDSIWTLAFESESTKGGWSAANNPIWVNFLLRDSASVTVLSASAPVTPVSPVGTMEIQTVQSLDDSASFVIYISDVDFTSAEYTLKYIVYSGGEEIKSNVSEVITDGTEGFHLTSPNLTPETEYEIQFILQKDGVDTSVTTSTSFTTLAGSGAEEGETPDYTGQLEDIQQSVDNVGTKLDGVQDTLTETKEEITSLPQKIATSITEGVKGLFIPSQEDLTAIKDKYEDMLSEKLGFIWQAFELLTNVVSGLHESLESGEPYEFTFPGIKLPMQGEEFVLVAETPVSLENDLMDVVRPVCGTIVGTVAVIDLFNLFHDLVMAIISGISAYEFENGRKREK